MNEVVDDGGNRPMERLADLTSRLLSEQGPEAVVKVREVAETVGSGLADQVKRVREKAPSTIAGARTKAMKRGSEMSETFRRDVMPEMGRRASQMQTVTGKASSVAVKRAGDTGGRLVEQMTPLLTAMVARTQPVVTRTITTGRGRIQTTATGLGSGLKDMAQGAAGSAQVRASSALSTSATKAKRTTREMAGMMFWFGIASTILVLLLFPKREDKTRLWNGTRQFATETYHLMQQMRSQ
jgi:hypothetical protein